MSYNGEAPAQRRVLPLSSKTQAVLDALVHANEQIRKLYEPALAVAAAINLVRSGNTGMAPFIGAGGVVLSKALEPLIDRFGEGEMTFNEVFERIGIPVVSFEDLPDVVDVETPACPEDAWADDGGQ